MLNFPPTEVKNEGPFFNNPPAYPNCYSHDPVYNGYYSQYPSSTYGYGQYYNASSYQTLMDNVGGFPSDSAGSTGSSVSSEEISVQTNLSG